MFQEGKKNCDDNGYFKCLSKDNKENRDGEHVDSHVDYLGMSKLVKFKTVRKRSVGWRSYATPKAIMPTSL